MKIAAIQNEEAFVLLTCAALAIIFSFFASLTLTVCVCGVGVDCTFVSRGFYGTLVLV